MTKSKDLPVRHDEDSGNLDLKWTGKNTAKSNGTDPEPLLLTVTVGPSYGNPQPVYNAWVNFFVDGFSGAHGGATIDPSHGYTDDNGQITAKVTSTAIGSFGISASAEGGHEPTIIPLSFSNGITATFSGPHIELVLTGKNTAFSDGIASVPLLLTVADENQNPVYNASVNFLIFGHPSPYEGVTIAPAHGFTNEKGQITASVTSTIDGSFDISATAEGGTTYTIPLSSSNDVTAFFLNTDGPPADEAPADIALGEAHILVVSDGSVLVCGSNSNGQLGLGSGAPSAIVNFTKLEKDWDGNAWPPNGEDVVAVAAGSVHSLALLGDGTLWSWGENQDGATGGGNHYDRPAPAQINGVHVWGSGWTPWPPDGMLVTQICARAKGSLALLSDGTVWTWGDGTGPGDWSPALVPGPGISLPPAVSIACGSSHNLAALFDGSVAAWGNNYYGQLGMGNTNNNYGTPTLIPGLANVKAVAAGSIHSMALLSDGTFKLWGRNQEGELGTGDNNQRTSPADPAGSWPTPASEIIGFGQSTAVLLSNGDCYVTGRNAAGQLGLGDYNDRNTFVHNKITEGFITKIATLGSGSEPNFQAALVFSLFALEGTIWAWGNNSSGQLGLGNTQSRDTPISTQTDVSFPPPEVNSPINQKVYSLAPLPVFGTGVPGAWVTIIINSTSFAHIQVDETGSWKAPDFLPTTQQKQYCSLSATQSDLEYGSLPTTINWIMASRGQNVSQSRIEQ